MLQVFIIFKKFRKELLLTEKNTLTIFPVTVLNELLCN